MMVSEGAQKSGSLPGNHVDQLLEEYLRVINDKDDQLHRLLRQLQEQEAAAGRREEVTTNKQRELSEQLRIKSRKLKEREAQASRDEETIRRLVLNAESLKKQLQESEERFRGHALAAHDAASRIGLLTSELSETKSGLDAMQAQKAKSDEGWAAAQQQLETQSAAVVSLTSDLEATTRALGDARTQTELLQARIQEMMPTHEHTSALATLEAKLANERAQQRFDIEKLKEALSSKDMELCTAQQALRKACQEVDEFKSELHATSKALDSTKHQLATMDLTKQQTERELREEAARCRQAHMESSERVSELERSLARSQDSLQRTTAELQTTCVQLERYKAVTEKAHEGAQAQNNTLQEQLRQCQDELTRARHLLETRERAMGDSASALARVREEAAHSQAELREKLASVTVSAASRAEECERLQHQLCRAQQEIADAQRRAIADERSLAQRLDEVQVGVQRLQLQLRDKEEAARHAELVHSKELQKLQHDHEFAMDDMRRRHQSEERDLHARLELARAELSERAGGSRGLEKELHHVAEVRLEMRSEMNRFQNAIAAKENVIESLRREADKQQAESAQLTQRLAAHERAEMSLRQRIEEAERAQLDSKAARERVEQSVVDLKKTIETSAANLATMQAQLIERDRVISGLRREVEELTEAKEVAFKEVAQEKSHRSKAALSLTETEERLIKTEMELRVALQEQQRLQHVIDASSKEVQHLNEAVSQRDAECSRLGRHAEDVELLAKRTAEELHQTVRDRDDTIQRLRNEQATVLPHLNEERGKNLVLMERLQHQQELSRMHMATAEQRIHTLEEALASRDAELAALQGDKARAEEQLLESHAQVASLTNTLDSREHKYQQRKEEHQKALQQVKEVEAAAVVTLQDATEQTTSANAIREKYKKEKAKMELLLGRMEERMHASAKREKEDHQRESDLAEKLKETEEALRRAQESLDARVGEVQTRYEEMCRQQEKCYLEATNDAVASKALTTSLKLQLQEAHRRAVSVESSYRELQRHVAASQAVALEEYVEETIDIKRACIDLVTRMHYRAMSCAVSAVKDGWSAAQKTVAVFCEKTRDTELQMARLQVAHTAELRTLQETHQRRLEAASAEHDEATAHLRQEVAEAKRSVMSLRESAQRIDGDGEQRGGTMKSSLEHLAALLEVEKRQTSSLRNRLAADEARHHSEMSAVEERRRILEHSCDKLKRQLDDRVLEQRHNEDELRELRAGVVALERVLDDTKRKAELEAERATKDHERLAAAVTARDAAEQRCDELYKQMDLMRGQLETARLSYERVVKEHQATQRTRDMRLEAVQAELATAAAERRRSQREVESLEQRGKELAKEVHALRLQEADILGKLQAYKAEASSLRERCANLESLKNINEASLAETQARERDLMGKIEELRNAQQLMQLCFDKQHEQLEVGRRLRQKETFQSSKLSL